MRRFVPFVFALFLLLPAIARAEETGSEAGPTLELEHLDLIPLGEFEREDFRKEHMELSKQLQSFASRIRSLESKLAKHEKKDDEAAKKLAAEIARLQSKVDAPLAALRAELLEYGLTDAMLELMAAAPEGPGRQERYSHRLILLLDDLDPVQRSIFEQVIPEVDGAYLAAQALRDRTELALKQSNLERRHVQGILNGFQRQTNVIEARFWCLVDYVLGDDQKAALWEMLPTRMRRHSTPQDHVYALPGLTPTQGARVKALITEIEAESAPDQALVRRAQVALRAKGLTKKERAALSKDQREANARLNALRRFAYEATKDILTESQIQAMKAIPPRVSMNDRRRDGRRTLQGIAFDAEQEAALESLRNEGRQVARQFQMRMRDLRKESGDVGPDSPQMMMMEMMSAGARGEVLTQQRLLLGRVFREILTREQVSGWVMGLYGDRR
jgi:hypothetical protein